MVHQSHQKLGACDEYNVSILCATKYSTLNFSGLYVFKAKSFLSVVIANEGAVHSTDFQLERIFQETTTNQIIIFTLKAWMQATIAVDAIIKIILIMWEIISDGAYWSCLYFKNEGFACDGVNIVAIDLWTQTYVIVQLHKSMMIIFYDLICFGGILEQDIFEFFGAEGEWSFNNLT